MPSSVSTKRAASSESPEAVVDTVVLRYFLLVDELDLLRALVSSPLAVPRIVYDPDEPPDVPEEARSEITRSIGYQRRVSEDPMRSAPARQQARSNAGRLEAAAALHAEGTLEVIDLADRELALVGRLTGLATCSEYGLRVPLGAGEAACLAIAIQRDLALVTDDGDALRALGHLRPGHRYERIRRLLIRAVDEGLRTERGANEIHREMRRLGFWDREEPFPTGS